MTRKRWIYVNGEAIPVEQYEITADPQSPTILKDYPAFVSPLDGTVVEGRRQFREHCQKHDVVPTADLAGMPIKHAVQEHSMSPDYREATKHAIAEAMARHRKT